MQMRRRTSATRLKWRSISIVGSTAKRCGAEERTRISAQKLPQLLRKAGFGDIGLNVYQPAEFVGGDIKLLVALTLDSVAQPALEAGLTNSDEINAASKRLHELVKDDDTVMSLPRIVQAWGRLI
jgi:hypothetical protein